MSADLLNPLPGSNLGNFVEELIAFLHLTPEQIEEIRSLMQSSGRSFVEAAVSLNLATPQQVGELTQKVLRYNREPSIIEAAVKREAHRRPIIHSYEPEDKCTLSSKLSIAHDPYSERSEKLRGLRTELSLRFGEASKAAMMAIVSPSSGEGRSQLAAELAIAFAQLERRTLLVDADFRSSSLHKLFPCSNETGLSQAISDGSQPHLFGVDSIPNLHLLTAGPAPSNPIEMLSSKRFEQLINGWRHTYDIVLFDTPPIAIYADALTVSMLVKRVLLVTRAGNTPIKEAKEMLRRLSITNSEILGAVVNKF